MPFLLLVVLAVVAWSFVREARGQAPLGLCAVIRVRNGADSLEALLRAVQSAGIGRVIVVDEGSSDPTLAIAQTWADNRPWVRVCDRLEAGDLPQAALVLDVREPDAVREAQRILRWLGSSGVSRP